MLKKVNFVLRKYLKIHFPRERDLFGDFKTSRLANMFVPILALPTYFKFSRKSHFSRRKAIIKHFLSLIIFFSLFSLKGYCHIDEKEAFKFGFVFLLKQPIIIPSYPEKIIDENLYPFFWLVYDTRLESTHSLLIPSIDNFYLCSIEDSILKQQKRSTTLPDFWGVEIEDKFYANFIDLCPFSSTDFTNYEFKLSLPSRWNFKEWDESRSGFEILFYIADDDKDVELTCWPILTSLPDHSQLPEGIFTDEFSILDWEDDKKIIKFHSTYHENQKEKVMSMYLFPAQEKTYCFLLTTSAHLSFYHQISDDLMKLVEIIDNPYDQDDDDDDDDFQVFPLSSFSLGK